MTAHAAFSQAIRDPDAPTPRGVRATRRDEDGGATAKRFAVYRNNVAVGLIEALEARFPAVRRIVGEAFFKGLARAFIDVHPPRDKRMTVYGDALPDFIAAFAPARDLPYLADVARIEAAVTRAYHAADAEPIGLDALAALPPERLGDARLIAHPSAALVASRFPVVSMRAENLPGAAAGQEPGEPLDMARAETALIVRPVFDVAVRALDPATGAFAAALGLGTARAAHTRTLGEAADIAGRETAFVLARALADLFTCGAILRIDVADA